jgi:hypothetical protein
MRRKKKQRNMHKKRVLSGWEYVAMWRDFRSPHISEAIQEAYI